MKCFNCIKPKNNHVWRNICDCLKVMEFLPEDSYFENNVNLKQIERKEIIISDII